MPDNEIEMDHVFLKPTRRKSKIFRYHTTSNWNLRHKKFRLQFNYPDI